MKILRNISNDNGSCTSTSSLRWMGLTSVSKDVRTSCFLFVLKYKNNWFSETFTLITRKYNKFIKAYELSACFITLKITADLHSVFPNLNYHFNVAIRWFCNFQIVLKLKKLVSVTRQLFKLFDGETGLDLLFSKQKFHHDMISTYVKSWWVFFFFLLKRTSMEIVSKYPLNTHYINTFD